MAFNQKKITILNIKATLTRACPETFHSEGIPRGVTPITLEPIVQKLRFEQSVLYVFSGRKEGREVLKFCPNILHENQ